MTRRLYYDDPYLTRFQARVVERLSLKEGPAVVLDRTAFYPTSGGQPFDQGRLSPSPEAEGEWMVRDVSLSEREDVVLHWLDQPLPPDVSELVGHVDWERRFDHMQQHTGQHVLSQAFEQLIGAQTVSFHLGAESVTIDLDRAKLRPDDVDRVETLANTLVWENRPVTARWVPPEELDQVPLRKPPAVSGDVRVVQVQGFDWSACGGTHVAHTGEIGMIKVLKWERRGQESRVAFVCGARALEDYGQKNRMINAVADSFSVGHWELDQAVERLRAEVKESRTQARKARKILIGYQVADLLAQASLEEGVRVVQQRLDDYEPSEMRELAQRLTASQGVVALLGLAGDTTQLCFARSDDVELDVVPLVREAGERVGGGRGGGRPHFAQGGGPAATPEQLNAALDWAYQTVRQALASV